MVGLRLTHVQNRESVVTAVQAPKQLEKTKSIESNNAIILLPTRRPPGGHQTPARAHTPTRSRRVLQYDR